MKLPNCPVCKYPPSHSFVTIEDGTQKDFSYSCVGPIIFSVSGVDHSKQHSPLNTAVQPTREAAKQNWVQIVRDVKRRKEI